jgi:hypothetical protein
MKTVWLILILLLNILIHVVIGSASTENMQLLSPMKYLSQNNTIDVFENTYKSCKSKYTDVVWHVPDKESNFSNLVNPNESLIFFASTEYRPKCCAPTCDMKYKYALVANPLDDRIGRTTGCPCLSNEQITYLQKRGGNHDDSYDNIMT